MAHAVTDFLSNEPRDTVPSATSTNALSIAADVRAIFHLDAFRIAPGESPPSQV